MRWRDSVDIAARGDCSTPPDVQLHNSASVIEFKFESDGAGYIIDVVGIDGCVLIGACLQYVTIQGAVQFDAGVIGAFRHRTEVRDGRLEIDGRHAASGSWRIAATPIFDPASGSFRGYQGTGRRPRPDESALPGREIVLSSP